MTLKDGTVEPTDMPRPIPVVAFQEVLYQMEWYKKHYRDLRSRVLKLTEECEVMSRANHDPGGYQKGTYRTIARRLRELVNP